MTKSLRYRPHLFAVTWLVSVIGTASAQCPPTFATQGGWFLGEPQSVAVGDFDGDGRIDLATANRLPGTVTVKFADTNQPAGTSFTTVVTIPGMLEADWIVAADVNHDGITDLATLYRVGGVTKLAVLISNGNRTFRAPAAYTSASAILNLLTADIDGDGVQDLVALVTGGIAVLQGGAGPWTGGGPDAFSVRSIATTSSNLFALADLNLDGALDAVLTEYYSGEVRVALATAPASASFAAPVAYATGFSTCSVPGIGDFNGDGRPDVVVSHGSSNLAQVLLSTSSGTLVPQPATSTGYQPGAPAVADFNGDGRADIAVTNGLGSQVGVHLGDGNGGLSAPTSSTYSLPNRVIAADMNFDGRPDLVMTSAANTSIRVRPNSTPLSSFSSHPLSRRVCAGGDGSATFFVAATTAYPGGVTGYQWERLVNGLWETLVDGTTGSLGTVTGALTQTLEIEPVSGSSGDEVARIRAVALTSCGSFVSSSATLSLILPCGGADVGATGGVFTGCGDGVLDNNDFVVFIDLFFNGDVIADVGSQGGVPGADGQFNNNDFVVFIDMFFSGCT